MNKEYIKLGQHNIVVGRRFYSSEKDYQQAIKDIERILRILSGESVTEIVMALAPYRKAWAQGEDKCRAQLEEFAKHKCGAGEE